MFFQLVEKTHKIHIYFTLNYMFLTVYIMLYYLFVGLITNTFTFSNLADGFIKSNLQINVYFYRPFSQNIYVYLVLGNI